tara:strand:+ start:65 stop:277 length:213 start_codon:yes stop_codon:yes gene_type:complete
MNININDNSKLTMEDIANKHKRRIDKHKRRIEKTNKQYPLMEYLLSMKALEDCSEECQRQVKELSGGARP